MRNNERRKIGKAPHRQKHQPNEEKGGESHDPVDHFAFGNKVHEIAGDQEGLAAGNDQRDADIDGPVAKGNVGGADGNQRAEQQRVKDKQIAPNVMAKMIGMLIAHKLKANIGLGKEKSRPDRRSAKKARKSRCDW